ncbi:hypothetical protein B0H98_102263 [Vreelandella songnenensis]|uniref:Uncharacterized protein n=1 Tax=Vreelandella songnenensis TaxID=1176243 RepID=A0A2T0V6D6_9GAMM|nr:hypothetical protein [Halomonas songnenensis]PRY65733.1 hypothetical protein B0H98_102263 [Halomonas songnenensis]
MEWLKENAQAISAIGSILTLFVWVFYAQLLYNGYARQRRPRIIINRGKGVGLEALCLISNMSNEAIYVQHLVAVLHTKERSYELDIVEYQQQGNEEDEASYRTHQGPLNSGDYLHIQSFNSTLERLTEYWDIGQDVLRQSDVQLEIRVIAIYGPEDMPIGASRHFKLNYTTEPVGQLIPTRVDTQRMNSRRDRKRVLEWAKNIELHKAR